MGIKTWTDERAEMAREMWLAGHSSTRIAMELGEVSRNAVIGKVHRMLAPFPDLRKRNSKPKPGPKPKAPKITKHERVYVAQLIAKPKPKLVQDIPLDARTERSLSFDQAFREYKLTPDCCKWIVGDVGQPDWFYCGETVERGPYCGRHAPIAYQPLIPR